MTKKDMTQRFKKWFFVFCSATFSLAAQAQANIVPDDVEYQVLKTLYEAMGGTGWTRQTNWPVAGAWPATATSAQFGTWAGVTVTNGDITTLNLGNNNLVNAIPAVVNQLKAVTALTFATNPGITGSLPAGLGELPNLLTLNVSSCALSGPLPGDLFLAPRLRNVTANTNDLSGELPATLASCLTLEALYLNANQLSGSIPVGIGNLTKLTQLRLDDNQFTDNIPPLNTLVNLVGLYIGANQLTGAIPDLRSLTKLQTLYLSNLPALSPAPIPAWLTSLTELRAVYLLNTRRTGTLPEDLGDLGKLTTFYAQNNSLEGTIPESIGSLVNLRLLDVSGNKLQGEVPAGIGNLVKMETLYLYNNQLEGELPPSLANLQALVTLNASNNRFTGPFPAINAMPFLRTLTINKNGFTGQFPDAGGCIRLQTIAAAENAFTSVHPGLINLSAVTSVSFLQNSLTSFPDFSAVTLDRSRLAVYVSSNYLDFTHLEPNAGLGWRGFGCSPMYPIVDVAAVALHEGQPLTITARPVGQFTTVAWEKQNPDKSWSAISTDQDSNPQTYTRTSATLQDEGIYRWKMTSTTVGILTLYSAPIEVKRTQRFTLDDYAFQYRYDARKRVIGKKVPGADWMYFVYDDRDRLVLTQDGEQRKTRTWMFTKYDALNRPILTGTYIHTDTSGQQTMSGLISKTLFYETYTGDAGNHGYSNTVFPVLGALNGEVMSVTYYDNYDFLQADDRYAYTPNELEGQYRHDHSNASFPRVIGQVTGTRTRVLGTEPCWLQTVRYYDDKYRVVQTVADNYKEGMDRVTNLYDFEGRVLRTRTSHSADELTWQNQIQVVELSGKLQKTGPTATASSGASSLEQIPAGADGWAETSVTEVNKVRVFGLSDADPDLTYASIDFGFYLNSNAVMYIYEGGTAVYTVPGTYRAGDKLRIGRVGTQIRYYKNGIPVWTSAKTSAGVLMIDVTLTTVGASVGHARISAAQRTTTATLRDFAYDPAGRLVKSWHQVGDDPARKVLLAQHTYNELGQLVDKKLHSTDQGQTFKQSVDYRYNIRGWLTSINNTSRTVTAANDDADDLFGMDLAHEHPLAGVTTPGDVQYNGNISAITYSTVGNTGIQARGYAYVYDPLNRLHAAAHREKTTDWQPAAGYHEDNLAYDLNGNIRTLARRGANGSPLDNLTYTYTGNRLLQVNDAGEKNRGFTDGLNRDDDYTYDGNGNMISDKNKDITAITYNYLNLPDRVTKKGGAYVRFLYDASGRKHRQEVYDASGTRVKTTDYAGEFIYENDTLILVKHEEGRVVTKTPETPEYQYYLKDHLGNVRVTFSARIESEDVTATLEPDAEEDDRAHFLFYDEAVKVTSQWFDHTLREDVAAQDGPPGNPPGDPPSPDEVEGTATRLLGGNTDEQYGLARSISVMPGDVITAEVFAKYIDPAHTSANPDLSAILDAIQSEDPSIFVDGGLSGSMGNAVFPFLGLLEKPDEETEAPKAYLNYLLFDRQFNFIDGGYKQITTAGRETGDNVDHDRLAFEGDEQIVVSTPGYVYLYISNENDQPVEVYFDDFKVMHTKSPIVQFDDYYPFGLTFNSYSRGNGVPQNFLYQEKEWQQDLSLNLYDFEWRQYDPFIGRTTTMDPRAEMFYPLSPYSWAGNNPLLYVDPDGRTIIGVNYSEDDKGQHYDLSNASEDTKKMLWSMLQTKEGQNQASFLGSTETEVTMQLTDQLILDGTGDGSGFGLTASIISDGTMSSKNSKVYDKAILLVSTFSKKTTDIIQQDIDNAYIITDDYYGNNNGSIKRMTPSSKLPKDIQTWLSTLDGLQTGSMYGEINANATHEANHLRPENMGLSPKKKETDANHGSFPVEERTRRQWLQKFGLNSSVAPPQDINNLSGNR